LQPAAIATARETAAATATVELAIQTCCWSQVNDLCAQRGLRKCVAAARKDLGLNNGQWGSGSC